MKREEMIDIITAILDRVDSETLHRVLLILLRSVK